MKFAHCPSTIFLGLIANKADLEVTRQKFPANFFVWQLVEGKLIMKEIY